RAGPPGAAAHRRRGGGRARRRPGRRGGGAGAGARLAAHRAGRGRRAAAHRRLRAGGRRPGLPRPRRPGGARLRRARRHRTAHRGAVHRPPGRGPGGRGRARRGRLARTGDRPPLRTARRLGVPGARRTDRGRPPMMAGFRLAVLTLVSAGAMLCGLWLLDPLVSGSGWLPPSAAVLTAMALVGAGLRFLPRGAALLVPPAQLLVALAVVTAVFAPQAAVAGFVPTPASLDELGRILLQGRQEIDANPPPVAGPAGVALVFALGAAAAGAAGDVLSVTARTPALTGVPL